MGTTKLKFLLLILNFKKPIQARYKLALGQQQNI